MATRSSTMTRSTMTRSVSGDDLKEKRGTSPSNSHTQRKTITRSASDAKEKSSSSSSSSSVAAAAPLDKNTPNYLKATRTLTSRSDQPMKPNNVKKSSNISTTEDQKLLRRRSFDKPPSSAPRIQKALISPPTRPRERTAPLLGKEKASTVRSSSFSGRSNGTTKPVLDRSVTSLSSSRTNLDSKSSFVPKTPKAVKPQPVFTSRTTKKRVKTKESSASSSTLNQEAKQEEEKECLSHEVHEEKVESETEVHDHNDLIPKAENNEQEQGDQNHEEVIDNKTCEISTVPEDQNVIDQAPHVEETEEKSQEEAKIEENSKETDVVVVESDHDDNHQHEEITQSGGEKEEESSNHHEIGDENKAEEKAHQDGEVLGRVEEVAKQEPGNRNPAATTLNKRQSGQGKKESPTAYNDVIEETASKLLEKRKNKVKALVGAFETVIDYESGASK